MIIRCIVHLYFVHVQSSLGKNHLNSLWWQHEKFSFKLRVEQDKSEMVSQNTKVKFLS